jgi:hypothetical protein
MQNTSRLRNIVLFSFIVLKFILQYHVLGDAYELHRDEFLHLDQANHLAWGYLSVPPMTSWISYLIGLLGNSIFWIKFFPTLFGALTMVVVWKAIEALQGTLFACILGATCITLSVLCRLNVLYQPNSLDVLCWTSVYYFLLQYIRSDRPKWLYFLAVAFAIGFLNKYNIVFLFIGLFPAITITSARKVFFSSHFYRALLLAIVLVSPNLFWQYRYDFPVFLHLNELADTQLAHVSRWSFISSPLFYFSGSLILMLVGLYALATQKAWITYRPFLWAFVLTFALFIALKAKSYYAIGMYPIYFAFGAAYTEKLLSNSTWFYRAALMILPILFFLPIYNTAFPNKPPEYIVEHQEIYRTYDMLRWEDGKQHALPQDFADMLGWKELARKVDSVYSLIVSPEQTLVLCDNYGQAGAINYYSTKGIQAVSFQADYVNWFNLNKPYKHLIRIKQSREEEQEMRTTAPFFRKSVKAGQVTNVYAREYGTIIFLFTDSKIDLNERIRAELQVQPAFFHRDN